MYRLTLREARRAVYGFFSRAGRFCYQLDAGKSVSIVAKDVIYVSPFWGMTQQQVKARVFRVLEARFRDIGEV